MVHEVNVFYKKRTEESLSIHKTACVQAALGWRRHIWHLFQAAATAVGLVFVEPRLAKCSQPPFG